jgi:putative salt-induced outer membrane protein
MILGVLLLNLYPLITHLVVRAQLDDYLRGRALGEYKFEFTEKTRFTQSLEYLHDFDNSENYNINSETALITALSDKLSLKTSYVVNYDNEPIPDDLEETDTTLAVTLIVNL